MKQFLLKSKLLLASLSVAATVGIVAVVVMLVSKDDEAYRTIKVIETSGEVKVTREDGEYAAYSGMILEEGYEIETAENSYVRLILDDDKYVKVEQGSKIIFEKLGLFGSNKTKIKIERGAMTCEIVKPLEGDDDFTVNTPNAVLAVRGTFFRVDLNYNDDGLVKTNVMTYGGKVAAQRVLSTGELVGTEVDVDTGNKVIISQINEVEDDGNVAENVIFESQVISVEDITDEDLVDVYFAIENGHEMFLDIEDVQDVLDIREIDIKEHISVYEKAKNIEENTGKSEVPSVTESEATTQLVTSQETSTEEETTEEETTEQVTTEETTSKLITIETTKAEETTTKVEETTTTKVEETTTTKVEETTTTKVEETTTTKVEETTTTKVEETTTTKVEETTTTKVEETITTKVEETTTTKVEETTTKVEETTTKEEETTTEHIHTEVNGGEASIHKKCSGCGETLENGSFHEYTIEVTKTPTCTSLGVKTYSCGCGYSYTEDIPMESHVEVAGNEANVHKKCNTCGTTIEDGTYHSYTKEETSSATCTEKGENTYTCTCGHTYTEEIDYLDHNGVAGGEEEIHKKCGSCGETLENGSFHEYTIEVTKAPTCTALGERTYTCGCGYSYTEDIPMELHVEVAGNEANVHKKCNTCGTTIEDGTYHSYTKEETTSPTCTEKGENTYTCTCGHTYTEEIDYLDHNGVAGGEEEIHKKCGSCGETLENGSFHEYTIEVTKAPTCTALGVRTYTCGCGYSYTEDITMESHVEVAGNEANVHKKCNTCGTTIEDGTYHSYTKEETTSPTCTEKGENTYTCTCGHTYTEEIAALGHTKADENASSTTCITCGLPWVDISTTNFEDATLRTKLSEFDTDGDGALIGAELTDITSISVAGTADADGECKSLSGVELLPNLTQIDCSYNADLLSLDFSGNTKLYKLYCNNTGVQTINISGCTGLSTFDFTNCSELIEMNVSNTTLTSLIINSNPALATLNVEGNKFTTLNISGTQITSLELNNMSKSTNITVTDTPIQTVTISDSTLGNLTVSAISQLESITSTNSTINRVFADDCSGLKVLSVPDSEAVLVSIENTTLLEELNVSGSGLYDSFRLEGSMYPQLKTLDISNTENITSISVSECASLTSLNVTGCNMITSLDASNTAITSIDVTGCEMLGALDLNPTEIGSMADVTLPATHQIGSFGIGTYASSDVDIVFDASDIAWFSGLSSLDVSNARLDNDDFAAIKNVIGDNITTFKFSGNNSTNTGTTSGYLTELDLSGMKYIPGMEYSELSDVTLINISDSNITSIDFSGFTNLKTINAANSKLAELNASSNVLLETIDVSGCTILASIVMNYTENTYALSSVNLTGCTALVDITLYGCSNLTTMDLTDCTNLEIVSLESCTGLTSIDLSNNDKLTGVALSHTNITTLDLSGKTSISQVYLMNCANLTTIDLSNSSVDYINLAGCTSVTSVNVTGNTNANQILSVHYTGTAYDDAVFTKSDGFTVEQEPMA